MCNHGMPAANFYYFTSEVGAILSWQLTVGSCQLAGWQYSACSEQIANCQLGFPNAGVLNNYRSVKSFFLSIFLITSIHNPHHHSMACQNLFERNWNNCSWMKIFSPVQWIYYVSLPLYVV